MLISVLEADADVSVHERGGPRPYAGDDLARTGIPPATEAGLAA